MFALLLGYAGSGRCADLVPTGQVGLRELIGNMCGWWGGFGIAHRGCGAGAGLENQTRAGLCPTVTGLSALTK